MCLCFHGFVFLKQNKTKHARQLQLTLRLAVTSPNSIYCCYEWLIHLHLIVKGHTIGHNEWGSDAHLRPDCVN